MEITNEDKIVLLEALGFNEIIIPSSGSYRADVICWSDSSQYYSLDESIEMMGWSDGVITKFNPLDMSILSKALDIIEKEYNTISSCINSEYRLGIFDKISDERISGGEEYKTREEAIFKACVEYFKQQKS